MAATSSSSSSSSSDSAAPPPFKKPAIAITDVTPDAKATVDTLTTPWNWVSCSRTYTMDAIFKGPLKGELEAHDTKWNGKTCLCRTKKGSTKLCGNPTQDVPTCPSCTWTLRGEVVLRRERKARLELHDKGAEMLKQLNATSKAAACLQWIADNIDGLEAAIDVVKSIRNKRSREEAGLPVEAAADA